jgi:hypothetical protein
MPHIPGLCSPYDKVGRLVYFGRMLKNKLLQAIQAIIAPACLGHESIPYDAVLVGARRATCLRPSEYLLVRSALKSARHEPRAYMRADKQLSETERQKHFGKFTGTSGP